MSHRNLLRRVNRIEGVILLDPEQHFRAESHLSSEFTRIQFEGLTMTRPFSVSRSTSSVRLSLLGLFAVIALALAMPSFAQDPYGGTQNGNQYPVSRGPVNPNGNNGPYGSYNAPNAIPEGTRFIAVLDDKLETQKIQQGKKFKL